MQEPEILGAGEVRQFYEQGYVVVPELIEPAWCDRLRDEALNLVQGFDPPASRGVVFSTLNRQHEKERYFRASDQNISFFFEEGAYDAQGSLQVPKERAINKIGHALHSLDPVFQSFVGHARLRQAVSALNFIQNPIIVQSMYIFKQPLIGGEVSCHQDSTFIHTPANRLLALWIAIEDSHEGNGCLWGLPGAYSGEPRQKFYRDDSNQCRFEESAADAKAWDLNGLRPLEIAKGGAILFHGLFPHLSYSNRSCQSRHALTLHLIDGSAAYPPSNWIRKGSRNFVSLH